MKNKLVKWALLAGFFTSLNCNVYKESILGSSYNLDLNGDYIKEKVSFNKNKNGYLIDVGYFLNSESKEPWIRAISSLENVFIPEKAFFYDLDKDGDLDLFLEKDNKFIYCENKPSEGFSTENLEVKNLSFFQLHKYSLNSKENPLAKLY